jgi:uncharacterized protein YecT (DUF1311 family)
MIRIFFFTIAAAFCVCHPGLAQDLDCKAAMTQQEMNICALRDMQAADAEMKKAYQQAISAMRAIDDNLPPELTGAEEAVVAAQLAWSAYSNVSCKALGFALPANSAKGHSLDDCHRRMILNRTAELKMLTVE